MTVNFSSSTYQTDTPRWLWQPWTHGPGARPERYADRLQALIALDTLLTCPQRLDPEERALAHSLTDQLGFCEHIDIEGRVEDQLPDVEPGINDSQTTLHALEDGGRADTDDTTTSNDV